MTLVSSGEKFQLGFFSLGNSTRRYLGIWYYRIVPQTIVWVANREIPLNGNLTSSGVLKFGGDGNLVLLDHNGTVVWSTDMQNGPSQAIVAQLFDSGNFVLRNERSVNPESNLWQSFDYPTDTTLSGMKLGSDSRIGDIGYLRSWKSADDPYPGNYSYAVESNGLPQTVLREGSLKRFRSGPWNGEEFSGIPLIPNPSFSPTIVIDSDGVITEINTNNAYTITRSVLTYLGTVDRYIWNTSSLMWLRIHEFPSDDCDNYERCGPNSVCTSGNTPICSCLPGYVPKSSQDWGLLVWSGGCILKHPLNCSKGEGFLKLEGMKMPDLLEFWLKTTMTLDECRAECLKNCNCTAYTNSNVTEGGSGCLLWYGDLVDIKKVSETGSQSLYIRVTASDLGSHSQKKRKTLLVVTITASVALLVVVVASFFIWKAKLQKRTQSNIKAPAAENSDLPVFDLVTIAEATNNFSYSNKIGEGGFGPVYKGQLPDGQEIAVKRLSEDSHQGLSELKNEVILIAKLQHRNLVRLLGCCIEGTERMLIYEYMPNGSLDSFIFAGLDGTRKTSLDWTSRFNIIVGIARGLLYLHRDSRLRIIHRDLKASNVLLDNGMNPKISDFGLARAFGGDQSSAKTKRVVGTYGYMSPEYAIDGLFSMKSDVFSFGVLVLEIVSGRQNRNFHHPSHGVNLIGHAWKLWLEGDVFELIDPVMKDPFPVYEVLRCIQVGLLCVQQRPEDRPTMSLVLLMLDSENVALPQPKQPGFFTERSPGETEGGIIWTVNEATNSILDGR